MGRRRRPRSRDERGSPDFWRRRRQKRDDRSRRGRPHGHRGRVAHRPRAGGADGGRSAGRLPRRKARTGPLASRGGIPTGGAAQEQAFKPRADAAGRGRRERLYGGLGPDRHRRLSWRDRRDVVAPRLETADLALDLGCASPRDVFAAQRSDHRADQLSCRRDRHPAGHLPARAIRRLAIRGEPSRGARPAGTRGADDVDYDRRPDRLGDHRRDRLDEHARGDRRA